MDITPLIQGTYYVVTGVWPVLNMQTFEKISGEKTDKWLVKTVALVVVAIGIVILFYSEEDAVRLLAILSAASLAVIDIFYSFKGVISKVYLLDAAANIAFIAGWLLHSV